MSENQNMLKLDPIPEQIAEPLRVFTSGLMAALADNLQSVTVVGSAANAATGDYRPGRSDINTVVVLTKETLSALKVIASFTKPMGKKRVSPALVMTPSYIERSRDVFGVEFLDFQLVHQTIFGEDPFARLAFEKSDVRVQCERELKAMLVRLRQGYIASAGNKKLVRDILISTAKSLAPLLRAMLWLRDVDRPNLAAETFRKAASEFAVNLDAVAAAGNWRYERPRLSDAQIENAFETVYTVVDRLAGIVDELEL